MNHSERQLIRALTVEIVGHLVIWALVVVPVTALLLPALITSMAFVLAGMFYGQVAGNAAAAAMDIYLIYICVVVCMLLGVLGGWRVHAADKRARETEDREERQLHEPSGASGKRLTDAVERIWSSMACTSIPTPVVLWYPKFDVSARAVQKKRRNEIHVSSGLWQRIANNDPVGDVILAHESAHFIHGDIPTFRWIENVTAGARSAIRASAAMCACGIIVILICVIVYEYTGGAGWSGAGRAALAAFVLSLLGVFVYLLADLIIRRYASMIVALTELRADIAASFATIGPTGFAEQFRRDPALHRSTIRDLHQSLLSPEITHLSESERVALLRNRERLATPKTRYFTMSIALALLVSLNPITPLVASSIDHLIAAIAGGALCAIALTMFYLAAPHITLSWPRLIAQSTIVVLAPAVAQINLYEVGYLLTHWGVALANKVGFGNEPITPSLALDELTRALQGVGGEIIDAVNGWRVVLSIFVTLLCLSAAAGLGRRPAGAAVVTLSIPLLLATSVYLALLVCYDPERGALYSYFPLCLGKLVLDTGGTTLAWLWRCLPAAGFTLLAAISYWSGISKQ